MTGSGRRLTAAAALCPSAFGLRQRLALSKQRLTGGVIHEGRSCDERDPPFGWRCLQGLCHDSRSIQEAGFYSHLG